MKLQIKAGLITALYVAIAIGVGSLAIFAPEVFTILVAGCIFSGVVYHLYHHILYNLQRTVDPKRDSM